jgi:hypothetical protein
MATSPSCDTVTYSFKAIPRAIYTLLVPCPKCKAGRFIFNELNNGPGAKYAMTHFCDVGRMEGFNRRNGATPHQPCVEFISDDMLKFPLMWREWNMTAEEHELLVARQQLHDLLAMVPGKMVLRLAQMASLKQEVDAELGIDESDKRIGTW